MEVGKIYYSKQDGSEWLIWHEIEKIENGIVTMAHYGHDTECFTSTLSVKELKSAIRRGLLKEA